MSYFRNPRFADRVKITCRGVYVPEEVIEELLKLSYSNLVAERAKLENIAKHYHAIKDMPMMKGITFSELNFNICAYRKAIKKKEKQILKQALRRR